MYFSFGFGVLYIIDHRFKAYARSFFDILQNPELENGTFHLLEYIKRCQECLSAEHWEFVSEVFVRNSYFIHPENLLYCGLLSKFTDDEIRTKCADKIIESKISQKKSKAKFVRKMRKPTRKEINLGAKNIFNLIDWGKIKKAKIRDPPLLRRFTKDDVKKVSNLDNEMRSKILHDKLLCHSQHCERCVKQTTISVLSNSSHDAQKSHIIVTENSREKNSCTSTKESFRRSLDFVEMELD